MIEGFVRDGRVGHSHLNVIKDMMVNTDLVVVVFRKTFEALISYGDSVGVDLSVLKGAWKTNLKVRPEKDWERLKGRKCCR